MNEAKVDGFNKEVYLHISNGGVTFKITESKFGPKINVRGGSFGMTLGELDIITNKESLKALAELFKEASEKAEDVEKYCPIATIVDYSKRGNGSDIFKEDENVAYDSLKQAKETMDKL